MIAVNILLTIPVAMAIIAANSTATANGRKSCLTAAMPIAKPTPTIAINLPNEPFNQSDTLVTKAANSAPVVAADADNAKTANSEKMRK